MKIQGAHGTLDIMNYIWSEESFVVAIYKEYLLMTLKDTYKNLVIYIY